MSRRCGQLAAEVLDRSGLVVLLEEARQCSRGGGHATNVEE